MSEPDYWGRCDTCGDPLTGVGRISVYSTAAGNLRFRFCDGDCKDRFQNRDVHAEFDRGELVTDGGTGARDNDQLVQSALDEVEGLQRAIRGGAAMYPSDLEGVREKLERSLHTDTEEDGGLRTDGGREDSDSDRVVGTGMGPECASCGSRYLVRDVDIGSVAQPLCEDCAPEEDST